MSVPDDRAVVAATYASGSYDLKTHEGHASFVDAAVARLHTVDSNWGHLAKRPGQTQIHKHAEDAALYKLPNNEAIAVDFVVGAGGPNPSLGWGVGTFVYTHKDWLDPDDHDAAPPTPPPASKPYPGDAFFIEKIGAVLEADYAEAGQRLNAGSAVWFSRTIWRHVNEGMTMEQSTAQSRKEWRVALGLPQ